MSNIYPIQERAIDAFSSYNSNIVNRLTRIVTRGTDALHSSHAMDVTRTDSTHVQVIPGVAFVDDVYIQITTAHDVDLEDEDYYFGNPWNEQGYYIVALAYEYVKAKPAPVAAIKIYKPSQQAAFVTSGHLFLKCLQVSFNGFVFSCDQVLNYHPNDPTNLRRFYTQIYAGRAISLPAFVQSTDEARIIYVEDKDELFFGTASRWESVLAVRDNIDTNNCNVGDLAYVGADGAAWPAISTGTSTFADCIVLQKGALTTGEGKARLYGRAYGISVETGRTATVGENMYLSAAEAGKCTDLVPEPYSQYVGTVVAISGGGTICDLWFAPGAEASQGDTGSSLYDYYQDLLNSSIFLRLTVDPFINLDYTDIGVTTAQVNTTERSMDGTAGDVFQSINLTDVSYDGTCIVSCQVSRNCRYGASLIDWFASNDGGTDWEGPLTIDDVHVFSTVHIPTAPIGIIPFQYGELVNGSISGLNAIYCGGSATSTLVRTVIGTGVWTFGEAVTGVTSGAQSSVTAPAYDRDTGYVDLKVKAEYNGPASIDDYGVIYDEDEAINEDVIYDSLNIDTLFSDLYTTPSQDSDGQSNLSIPIQTITTDLTNSNGYGVTVLTLGIGDTTPSVGDHKALYVMDATSAVNITTFIDAVDSQEIKMLFVNNSVTLIDGATMQLAGGGNANLNADDTLKIIYYDGVWYETGRSVN